MNATWKSPRYQRPKRSHKRVLWLATILLMLLVAKISCLSPAEGNIPDPLLQVTPIDEPVSPPQQAQIQPPEQLLELPPAPEELSPSPELAEPPAELGNFFTWAIAPGDTLGGIFDRFSLGQHAMHQILAADESLLALDTLRPGNSLTFTLDEQTRQMQQMELFIHPGNRVIYSRADDGTFNYEEIIVPGTWEQQLVTGEINGSFYLAATGAGLSDGETATVIRLFKDQCNFSRDIRSGDQFQIVRHRQFVEGEFTGQSRIEGVRILRDKRVHSAFLFDDGNYYDHKGDSLARAFVRYPTGGRTFRVTSNFNPRRLHPITGRVKPHNGMDFGMPSGTPVFSTGDGVVTKVTKHPYAGLYVEIQHGSRYTTRYLHLQRAVVKKGQSVKRGERIALSGNSGRSTGPHLHFELHVNNRPVNPQKAEIPLAASVPKAKLNQFNQRVAELVRVMEAPMELAQR